MKWFNNLTNPQKVILILIAGSVAIIGLSGLLIEPTYNFSSGAYQYPPNYVFAAIAKAIFSAILLLALSSPLFYLTRRSEITMESHTKQPLINWRRVIITVLVILNLGLIIIMVIAAVTG